MNGQVFDNEPGQRGFFSVEEHEEFTALKFGLHIPEHVTDLTEAGRLWDTLLGQTLLIRRPTGDPQASW